MKSKLFLFVVATSILFTNCASILNGKYQKISIDKVDENDEILVNGEPAQKKKGKYLFKRDLNPKQITIKSDGYMDENMVIMQYKKSPLYIMSWIPFAITFVAPLYDNGNKSWNYDADKITYSKVPILKRKSPESKYLRINKFTVDLEKDSVKYKFFPTYSNYMRRVDKKQHSTDKSEEIYIENATFAQELNEILKDKGYIDTTRNVLKSNYLENLGINATINSYTLNYVVNRSYINKGGMTYVDLSMEWEVLDYYNKTIYAQNTSTTSDEFAFEDVKDPDQAIQKAINNVIEIGLKEFIESDKVQELLVDNSELEKENNLKAVQIKNSDNFVSGLSNSIKSAVTITSKAGFGSGFVISPDGYIITNYHVIADTSDLKVVLHDKSKYKPEIIQISKIYDLALLKIDTNKLVPFKIKKSKEVNIASEIYAVGTPSGEDLSQTISKGIISGVRVAGNKKLIQTDASINAGNSGGPLINKKGEVIGIVSSKLSGFGVEGVAFGIPAYQIFEKLKVEFK